LISFRGNAMATCPPTRENKSHTENRIILINMEHSRNTYVYSR
jgi:hypothetical protein